MRGSVRIPPGVDLTDPTDKVWEAEASTSPARGDPG
jgi:hypothetical protein